MSVKNIKNGKALEKFKELMKNNIDLNNYFKELSKNNMSIDELIESLRGADCFSLHQVN